MSYSRKKVSERISVTVDRFVNWFNRRYAWFFTNGNKTMRLYEPMEEQLK